MPLCLCAVRLPYLVSPVVGYITVSVDPAGVVSAENHQVTTLADGPRQTLVYCSHRQRRLSDHREERPPRQAGR